MTDLGEELDDVDDYDDDDDGLEDIGLKSGQAKIDQAQTVRRHVGRFLAMFPIRGITNFDELSEKDIKPKILGRFADYITKYVGRVRKFNPHYQYVCSFNKMICDRFPHKEGTTKKYRITLRYSI